MTRKISAPGTIWSVPEAGEKALCLVISQARGVSRGRPEHQVVPLYLPDLVGRIHSSSDFRITAAETTLGVVLFAALWNLRPLLVADLGTHVGEITTPEVMNDLRDALLRLADPRIDLRPGRLGNAVLPEAAEKWRTQEVLAWQPLSGRVFEAFHTFSAVGRVRKIEPWILTSADQLQLEHNIERSEDLLGAMRFAAVGAGTVMFCTNATFDVIKSPRSEQENLFSGIGVAPPWNGKLSATHVDLKPQNMISIVLEDDLAKVA
jgi:hypothetical protein